MYLAWDIIPDWADYLCAFSCMLVPFIGVGVLIGLKGYRDDLFQLLMMATVASVVLGVVLFLMM